MFASNPFASAPFASQPIAAAEVIEIIIESGTFSLTGSFVVFVFDRKIVTGKKRTLAFENDIRTLAFASDDKTLAFANDDRTLAYHRGDC